MQQAGRYCTVSSDTSSSLLASRTDDLSQAPGASTPKPRPLYSVESLDYPFIPRLARFVKLGFLVSIIFSLCSGYRCLLVVLSPPLPAFLTSGEDYVT